MNSTSSLVDRAGLDRTRLAKVISRGLEGADDGELFLEYRQAEMLLFDNGRLKQATYDTSQGFGLRAVKDEAVGYAHASDVSEAAIARAADAVRAVKGGYSGDYAGPPPRSNVKLYSEESPLASPAFEAKARLLETIDAYARAKDPRVRQVSVSLGASWQAIEIVRGDGETYRDIRPLVRVNVSVVVGDGDRQEVGSAGYGGREGYERFITADNWQGAVDNA
ncbi:MAG TPA: DNA gyrase modulator, partial [Stellaceae bacterium]|nr:DNA gyrase modulator [Stellaceae bacterium]